MIKSKFFWAGAILLAIIPFIIMDIPKHYIDWHKEVRDEIIYVTQNQYPYTVQQKALILDGVLKNNKILMAKIYLKSFAGFLLFGLSIYCFYLYFKNNKAQYALAILNCAALIICSIGLKIWIWNSFNGTLQVKLLMRTDADTSLINIYNEHFKGKVVYVDFWGTTCSPCLEEFRNFSKPLKDKYLGRNDIAWLNIAEGTKVIWKQQLQKFNIQGWNLWLNAADYRQLFKQAIKGSKDTALTIPRYLIMDKHGKITETDAPSPSDSDSISGLLDKYLADK